MRYVIIENDVVVNMATAEKPIKENWIPSNTAVKGDVWDGTDFSKPVRPNSEILESMRSGLRARQKLELNKDVLISAGLTSNREELKDNLDLLDGTSQSKVHFENGHATLSITKQNTIRANMKAHQRAVNLRANAIATAVKAASGVSAKKAVYDAAIDTGWPS